MRKPVYIHLVLLLFLILVLNRCEVNRCLHSAGDMVKVRIETGLFKQVEIMDLFQVILVQDSTYYVEIEAGENEVDYIKIRNEDSILYLDNDNQCFWLRDYDLVKLYVHFDDIEDLNIQEASYLTTAVPVTDNFQIGVQARLAEADLEYNSEAVSFYTNKTTGGRYTFRGQCQRSFIYSTYSSVIEADSLITENADIYNHSIGDISVYVTNTLRVEITNSGNVYYRGSPSVEKEEISASGRLVHIDD